MTTAARPTFDPARGNDSKAPTFQYSSRDLSAHTKLKYSDEEEEDDTAALLAELEKIKKERTEEREQRQEEIMTGNPLIANKDFNVRRRWDDDVIFKNQARGVEDNPKKRFINDTLRSDFHRKFMNKYVK
ncbi:5384_t:CDS:2 [Entrophospora sp. SA101]|nr:9282_t:CDS:2 [Entrophospora candida]CAJ0642551.1 6255_t:CDS:2 [Entrophospora sp. SA101]CAG8611232.1 12256_t:CDS:2 [Entrophospora candida]CAJ0749139.1 5382_t:CDS:2 [Entrophospora sp. SA101]CAJ0749141.1 5384_t:CDS:2 [Entrophospora sp. SA101]